MNLLIKDVDYVKIDFNDLEFFYKWLKSKLSNKDWKFKYHFVNVDDSNKQEIIDKDYFYKPKEEFDYIMLALDNKSLYCLRNGEVFAISPNVRNPFVVIKGEIITKDFSLE